MNRAWWKIGAIALALILGLLAVRSIVSAQGPDQTPQPMPGMGGMGMMGQGTGMMGQGMGMMGRPQNSLLAIAATTIGIDQADLVAALNSGKTIADVAAEKNVALDKIVEAFLAPRAAMLDAAVAAGRITQAQADQVLIRMRVNVNIRLTSKYSTGIGFMDANGDGICDTCGTNQPMGRGMGQRGPWNR